MPLTRRNFKKGIGIKNERKGKGISRITIEKGYVVGEGLPIGEITIVEAQIIVVVEALSSFDSSSLHRLD